MSIDKKRVDAAEEQLESEKQKTDYDTREFTIEELVQRYDQARIYLPQYKKEFLWDEYQQSRLIESIILGLPIPPISVAEIPEIYRLEIIDGGQRIRTLAAFLTNELCLKGLITLENLNDFSFKDLSAFRQRKFKNTPVRTIVFSKTTEAVRHDIFDRLNTYHLPLHPMEKRKNLSSSKTDKQRANSSLDSLPSQKFVQPLANQLTMNKQG